MKPFRGLFLHVLREKSAFFSSKTFLKNFNFHRAINYDYAVKLKMVNVSFKFETESRLRAGLLGILRRKLKIRRCLLRWFWDWWPRICRFGRAGFQITFCFLIKLLMSTSLELIQEFTARANKLEIEKRSFSVEKWCKKCYKIHLKRAFQAFSIWSFQPDAVISERA